MIVDVHSHTRSTRYISPTTFGGEFVAMLSSLIRYSTLLFPTVVASDFPAALRDLGGEVKR